MLQYLVDSTLHAAVSDDLYPACFSVQWLVLVHATVSSDLYPACCCVPPLYSCMLQ